MSSDRQMDESIDLGKAIDDLLALDYVKQCPLAFSALRYQRNNLDNGDGSTRIYLATWFAIGQIHETLREQDDSVRDQDARSGNPQKLANYSEAAKHRVERNLAGVFATFSDISGQVEFIPDRLTRSIEDCAAVAWPEEWRIEKHKKIELAKFLKNKTNSEDNAEARIAHRAYHLLKAYRNPTTHAEDSFFPPRSIYAYASAVAELYELAQDFAARYR